MKPNPRVIDIVYNWLKDNGYTGLVHVDNECGCTLYDFCPCREMGAECQAGYRYVAEPDETDSGFDWTVCLENKKAEIGGN